jgi:hypothetical protein
MFTTQPHATRKAIRLSGDLACVRAEVVDAGLNPEAGQISGATYPSL